MRNLCGITMNWTMCVWLALVRFATVCEVRYGSRKEFAKAIWFWFQINAKWQYNHYYCH